MDTALDALGALTRRYAFAEVAALLAEGAGGADLTTLDVAQLQQLCAFGQRLMDLDAEDFGEVDAAADANTEHEVADRVKGDEVPLALRERALECRMPQSPRELHRGALGSLRPLYRLLLEVIDAHFRRRETTAVVAAVHIASEYAPLLVWEQVLGHAGDPALLPSAVGGDGSAWGDFDDRDCPHGKAEKSAAKRLLTVARENATGWRTYLDRQHSNVSHALAVCAAQCGRPCFVYNRLSNEDSELVRQGSKLALTLNDSAIVKLRHSAPVGHGFGVPSRAELLDAWGRTRDSLARLAPGIAEDDGFVLPGFATAVSTLAGQPLAPDTLLADTASTIAGLISHSSNSLVSDGS
ncbi:hypothetical protein [Allorhizocola rhizosphaerae]|uniref:hypothetical protein n=1 Tax=Allorhizocola rhizosphaerae TaxID=1872709 RepID=UPI000E3D2196|nr:hypothetical protein [Allorhizocola rhizosphaerae]